MKVKIKVKPNSYQEKIEKVSENEYKIWLKEKPIGGKVNLKLIKILKKYFGVKVEIKSGFTSRRKIVEIED